MNTQSVPPGLEGVIASDPDVMHGELCFKGTRVPLTVFLDNLAEGMGLEEFLKHYPSVSREQASKVLQWSNSQLRQAAGL